MKKVNKTRNKHVPEMLKEYDFSKGVRGKYAKRHVVAGLFKSYHFCKPKVQS